MEKTAMEARADAIAAGTADEAIWLLEHPALYTAGTSARPEDLTDPHRFPVHQAKRGGQFTYHGPGQRVVYVMLDVSRRGRDVRCFVRDLEAWVIAALAEFGVRGEIREGRVGVWVARPDKPPLPDGTAREDKIAAIGIRLPPLGVVPRAVDQRGPRPVAFRRHRALRHPRPWRHEPRRPRPAGHDAGRGPRAAPNLRYGVRGARGRLRQLKRYSPIRPGAPMIACGTGKGRNA